MVVEPRQPGESSSSRIPILASYSQPPEAAELEPLLSGQGNPWVDRTVEFHARLPIEQLTTFMTLWAGNRWSTPDGKGGQGIVRPSAPAIFPAGAVPHQATAMAVMQSKQIVTWVTAIKDSPPVIRSSPTSYRALTSLPKIIVPNIEWSFRPVPEGVDITAMIGGNGQKEFPPRPPGFESVQGVFCSPFFDQGYWMAVWNKRAPVAWSHVCIAATGVNISMMIHMRKMYNQGHSADEANREALQVANDEFSDRILAAEELATADDLLNAQMQGTALTAVSPSLPPDWPRPQLSVTSNLPSQPSIDAGATNMSVDRAMAPEAVPVTFPQPLSFGRDAGSIAAIEQLNR